MKALVTGASSGIGRDMAIYLSKLGYDLILVSRDLEGLNRVKEKIKTNSKVISIDLSNVDNCKKLYEMTKKENIDVLINNAGFGTFGKFIELELDNELSMIDLNIKSVHILTKLFLNDMEKRNEGYILNVASSAAFQPGPLMATYYATKAYVLRLTMAIYEELRRDKSKVSISALCPGPVRTNFNKVANVEFDLKSLPSSYVAKYAIDGMFDRKTVIVPGHYMRMVHFISGILPMKVLLKMTYNIQRKKSSKTQ
jgi:short-subunit dehydrogenase